MKEFQALDDQLSRPVSLAPPQESETLRVLRRGRERITKGWIRHHLAADAYGDPVYSPDASTARYWCALGAISWHFGETPAVLALARALPARYLDENFIAESVAQFNNFNPEGLAGVVALFDRAIAAEGG